VVVSATLSIRAFSEHFVLAQNMGEFLGVRHTPIVVEGGSGRVIRPFALVQQGLTRAIVNPETLSNSVSCSDSHHRGYTRPNGSSHRC
jgi:hypothetical protein